MNQKEIAIKHLGPEGAMLGSKSGYRNQYPDNLVVFNANVATKSGGKIWHGDLDLTLSDKILQNLSDELDGEIIYVLYENDYRFENESKTLSEIISKITTRYYMIASATGIVTMNNLR